MSKFHVGDRVRVASDAEISQGLEIEPGDVGIVEQYIEVPSHLSYPYKVRFDNGEREVFGDRELRPADIVALPLEGDDLIAEVNKHSTIQQAVDVVNHPPHYNRFPVEVINITEQLDFNRGNAVKYLARAGFKEGVDELEDLSKAAWYVNRAIEKLKKERESDDV